MADNTAGDLMDEVLTLEGLHDIDGDADNRKPVSRPAVSDRDVALFEEVLWQPTAEEAEHELDEHDVGNTDAHKEEETAMDDDADRSGGDNVRLSVTIEEQDYDIRSETAASIDGDDKDKETKPGDDGDATASAISEDTGATGDGDEQNRKRKHDDISPIKWISADAEAAGAAEGKKAKADKTEFELDPQNMS